MMMGQGQKISKFYFFYYQKKGENMVKSKIQCTIGWNSKLLILHCTICEKYHMKKRKDVVAKGSE